MAKDRDPNEKYGAKHVHHNTVDKYSIATTARQEYIASAAEKMKTLLSFSNPKTSALHFTSLFGCMSVQKDILAQEIYKEYPAEAVLDFFSALSVINHVLIFTNISPVLLRLKLADGRTRYDLPLDLFWECINDSMKCKCGYAPEDKVNSLQKMLRYHRKTYTHCFLNSSPEK